MCFRESNKYVKEFLSSVCILYLHVGTSSPNLGSSLMKRGTVIKGSRMSTVYNRCCLQQSKVKGAGRGLATEDKRKVTAGRGPLSALITKAFPI